ncbi:UTP--glucose-1-phosphate uridylyltransferase [Sediminispirochaeta smaragdinae]|uniref:UTP--glucose-1-phosphate uridylyltransferase n=1 Tax=Sediminispirochaeta smaragdinae (strain DSM 11293 / JCM 15392 / SEBR 4228) TaxID=573413 RepID=E1R299_SEDSS|nr:UTP--glucose-1-phosphate uridylyltransferase [Sediminispirochaeta smaragdinae]ADK81984.1 conserved hypothetical protein [Sediminispirochaeta smaragdinae DSM 11293]
MEQQFSSRIEEQFRIHSIDRSLTLSILDGFNRGDFDHFIPAKVRSIPEPDGKRIVDMSGKEHVSLSVPRKTAEKRLESLIGPRYKEYIPDNADRKGMLTFSREELERIGIVLYAKSAFGVLNGGSATSYVDENKNRDFAPSLFEWYRTIFERIAPNAAGKAKGITPAFIHPDGSSGPSFMELKMRALLLGARAYRQSTGDKHAIPLPLFQMTSRYNNDQILAAYEEYRNSPFLTSLIEETGIDGTKALSGIQPLIAAYTHSDQGRPKGLFTQAFGEKDRLLPLPGGHGQNFIALKEVYNSLLARGYRFAWLGNVDNLGASPDPLQLGFFALSDAQAAFEFSFKTAVDVKGGILIRDEQDRLNCADIGPAISPAELQRVEATGKPILFNCASALFDLKRLCSRLDSIIKELPLRFSDQKKDAGCYSQAEQVTWEVIGMLDHPLIFGVKKSERFLAAKLLTESLLTSGIGLDDPNFPDISKGSSSLRELGKVLNAGLCRGLSSNYGLTLKNGRWIPQEET